MSAASARERPVTSTKKQMNTRLPCLVLYVIENIYLLIKWLNWLHTSFAALRAGLRSNIEVMYSVY